MKILVKESQLPLIKSIIRENSEEVTLNQFTTEVKNLLRGLINNPNNKELGDFWRLKGFSKSKLVSYLIKLDLLRKEEKLTDNSTMLVKYKVPKENFDRKIKKLFIKLIERNVPDTQNEIVGEDVGGATGCDGVGTSGPNTLNVPLFGVQKRDFYKPKTSLKEGSDTKKDRLCVSFDYNQYNGGSGGWVDSLWDAIKGGKFKDGGRLLLDIDHNKEGYLSVVFGSMNPTKLSRNSSEEWCKSVGEIYMDDYHTQSIIKRILDELGSLGNGGHSFASKIVGKNGKEEKFFFDGDGSDRVKNVKTHDEDEENLDEATTTTSVGSYTYDVPVPFGDEETLNHKSLIQKSVDDGKKSKKVPFKSSK